MADYRKMYVVLCAAIDSVIDDLEAHPDTVASAKVLKEALLQAEDIYCQTDTP